MASEFTGRVPSPACCAQRHHCAFGADSDDCQIPFVGVADGVIGDGLVQGGESTVVGGRERKQIGVSRLVMSVQTRVLDELVVKQGYRTVPVRMVFGGSGASALFDRQQHVIVD